MATRNFQVTLRNATSNALTRTGGDLQEGVWTNDVPYPDQIPANSVASWMSESGGEIPVVGSVGQGTEGWVEYSIAGADDTLHIDWDNPFVGETKSSGRVTGNFSGQTASDYGIFYTYEWSDGTPMEVVGTNNSFFDFSGFSEAKVDVTLRSKTDVRGFLSAIKFDLGRGMRSLRPPNSQISLRALMGA